MRIPLRLFCTFVVLSGVSASLSNTHSNATVCDGQKFQLSCETGTADWYFSPTSNPEESPIGYNCSVQKRLVEKYDAVLSNPRLCVLVVKNINASNAGDYICKLYGANDAMNSTLLIVVDTSHQQWSEKCESSVIGPIHSRSIALFVLTLLSYAICIL